jgi:hypothetical protein
MPTASAAYGNTTVICATNGGNQQSFQIGWDNSNQFFANKGYIPRLFCEGGYAGNYRIYVSDTLNGGALGYFNGVTPTPVVVPDPVPSQTDTQTATADTTTATSDTPTATADTQTSTSNTDTSTQTTDTSTTTTTDSSTSTPDTPTVPAPAPVDGSTATSQPAPQPAPIPDPAPAVEPEPPAVAPEPPAVEPEPPAKAEEAPEVAPEAPVVAEEPPAVAEEPPAVIEESPVVPVEESKNEVTLPNGVVLTQEQAVAVALLQNPGELLQELFTNPAAAFAALGSVGADLSPEVRAKSEKVVISAVIAGNIATQAAASAAGLATYRRKA